MKYTISSSLAPRFENKLSSFAKKFAKFGDGALRYEKSEERYDEKDKRFVVDIEVEGRYQVAGYEFVATLESENGCNIIKKINADEIVPEIYRTRCECDHCKTKRNRKNTVVLKKDGVFVQVGKQCVVDYLGCNIENYANYIAMWKDIDEFVEETRNERIELGDIGYGVKDIIAETIAYVKEKGYISSAKADDLGVDSTSWMVKDAFGAQREYAYIEINKEMVEEAEKVIDFVKNIDAESDYEHNIHTLLSCTYVRYNNIGLVVSAVGYYLRKMNENKQKENKAVSEYVANVGEKIEFKATPICVSQFDSQFGMCYIYKFDVDGNDVVWKTSKCLEEVEMTITGTVKSCEQYKGRKQTVLTRCKCTA